MQRTLLDVEHEQFRMSVRSFLEQEAVPHMERWDRQGIVERGFFEKAGAVGFLGTAVPERYGGGGVRDFRYNQVFTEESQRLGLAGPGSGITLENDVCLPYFIDLATEEQQERWLPGICAGELVCAIAMTEPGAGSDLASMATTAVWDGADYVVNGAKTFISNGINADLIITAVKTDQTQKHRGISLFVLERGMAGLERGRNLEKIGLHSQDTAELFFSDIRVPAGNLLGEEGTGFMSLVKNLPQERLSIAIAGVAAARAALDITMSYCRERHAFGKPIGSFQNSRFVLAECETEVTLGQVFIDRCVTALNAGELTADEAAMAKWWCTELQAKVVNRCLQLHGGYGYMAEYPISRFYVDARITTIYGGTTEIMKEIIGRGLGF